ncbi:phage virion morphogenesis protein [Pseudoalteromonas sp. NEC-BIFX-2020_002]|uniref:phage virion morphogenesis protein n=1 Tax=Pseudoalteromonas sp. NEC-BIFX-2020_002 TaxID=2732353 RepID=UPI001477077D|nr:phage virion morphogenesis protein [Pseudoalteromonas sp. NEC-BIFX-2020_002]NNG44982.1 phage virion morphogenesis protein [Pseudoalteromonas sp. NEC-BIFX-2020_002]
MAGASIDISTEGATAVSDVLTQLVKNLDNLAPALGNVGEHLMLTHRDHFDEQRSPDGDPWQALSPDYAKSKKKNKDKILRLNDILRDTFAYNVGDESLEFGTNMEYAAIHQFGGTSDMIPRLAVIPARPFLGLSQDDEKEVIEILSDFLA